MPHTLLLADDSVTIRRVIELTFADEDVRVVSVSSGRDALAGIEAHPPDIVLADAGMADVSGYEIAAFVKGRPDLRHIPVILLAGAFEPLDEERVRQCGSDGVLVKPFEPQMAVARVRELLAPMAQMPPPAPVAAAFEATPEPPAESAPIDAHDALDRLDTAFAAPADGDAASSAQARLGADLAADLREIDGGPAAEQSLSRDEFGDWDLTLRSAPEALEPLPPPIALAPRPRPAPGPDATPLADAFTTLLAAEEGRPHGPLPAVFQAGPGTAAPESHDMDALVERIIARLGPDVRSVVLDLAERLVRAEIDRLKALR